MQQEGPRDTDGLTEDELKLLLSTSRPLSPMSPDKEAETALDLAATSDDGKPGHYLGKQIASYNANGRTEGEGVAKLKRTRQGQREEEEGGKASAGERHVRRRKTAADIEADADQGQLLLWQWRYLEAVNEIRAIIQQLEERDKTTIDIPPILSMEVEEGGYKVAFEHAEEVLQHFREILGVLTSTDEPNLPSSAELAPMHEESELLASNRSAASPVASDLGWALREALALREERTDRGAGAGVGAAPVERRGREDMSAFLFSKRPLSLLARSSFAKRCVASQGH